MWFDIIRVVILVLIVVVGLWQLSSRKARGKLAATVWRLVVLAMLAILFFPVENLFFTFPTVEAAKDNYSKTRVADHCRSGGGMLHNGGG